MDLRVSRPFKFGDRWEVSPFAEFFNLFNRNNPGANFVATSPTLSVPPPQSLTSAMSRPSAAIRPLADHAPITSLNQLLVPAGGLGDFFGPGTTVGIPFAAQLGVRVTF